MIDKAFSHYKILERLGEGGMGIVYKAEDTKLKRTVALKFLPPELTRDEEAKERFIHEAQAASALDHPNICTIYEIGETEEGQLFIAMACYEGETLKSRIAKGNLPVAEAIDIATQIAQGLQKAHGKGIVHRDIKPANIVITNDGMVKIVDFGLAKLAGQAKLTRTGSTMGTAAYMSPEQAQGLDVNQRTDIWSLGVVLFEMVTGKLPFRGEHDAALLYSIVNEEPQAMSGLQKDIPGSLASLISRTLRKDPGQRYQTTQELISDLKSASLLSPELPKQEKSIVVLPFENLSPDPDNAFFADGLTEEIIAELSKIQALRVISRTSAMLFKGAKKSVPAIAGELNVRYALEGSVRRAGNRVRITAQLIDAATDTHMWAERHSGTLEDIFDLQERLARRIVDALKVTLSPDEEQRLAARPITDPRAYEAWLRARSDYFLFTKEGMERGISLMNQALAIVGDNSLLYAGLATIHWALYDTGVSYNEETLKKAEAYAARALELNPVESRALFSMALGRYKRGDLQGLCRYAKRAVEIERNSDALSFLGFLFAAVGRMDEARRYAEEALATDPLMPFASMTRAVVDMFAGRFEEAAARLHAAIERHAPGEHFLAWWLGQAMAYAGREEEARGVFESVAKMNAGLFSDLSEFARRALLQDHNGVHEWLETHPYLLETAKTDEIYPGFLANFLAYVGDKDEALKWLEYAISWGFSNHRFMSEHNRFLEPLRGDPLFQALMEKARAKEEEFEA